MLLALLITLQQPAPVTSARVVSFQSGDLSLRGVVYQPDGPGPFPAVLYNHGSAPGMLNAQAFDILGPLFVQRGWVFFAPYRRGQGLSAEAGPYIGDQIAAARHRGILLVAAIAIPILLLLYRALVRRQRGRLGSLGAAAGAVLTVFAIQMSATRASAATMVRLLETDHLSDQLAARAWLEGQSFVAAGRIAVAGNSFGGVEAVLGAARAEYCAAIDASGGAESWSSASRLREVMVDAVRRSKAPIFFFQAENDYDLSASRVLSAEARDAGVETEMRIYPAFGSKASEGHSFAWAGSAVWAADVFRFLDSHCEP